MQGKSIISREESIYNVAKSCARHRVLGSCKNKFHSTVCQRCRFYLGRYVQAPTVELDLYMLTIEQEASIEHQINNEQNR